MDLQRCILSKKSFLIIILIFLSLDFTLSTVIFKKTKFWDNERYKGKPWRVISKVYHHGLSPYIDEIEKYGKNTHRLITNSLGFRDSLNRKISKERNNYRILLIGDSFIEGLGYDYQFTLSGLLQNYYGTEYEILNSAVASYSPSVYYFKTKYLITNGYKFDKALVFIDLSDIIDEMYLEYNSDETLKIPNNEKDKNSVKNRIYSFGHFLRDNFVTFRFLYLFSDYTEIQKNNLKDRFHASKLFKKNFFNIDSKELILYKMITVDRGNWTRDVKSYEKAQLGLQSSKKFLDKLFKLLDSNNIESYLIIYPWPAQIYFGDNFHQKYWKDFSNKKDIKFLSMYPYFEGENKEEIIFKNFILGDIHWNKNGTSLIFEAIKEKRIITNN